MKIRNRRLESLIVDNTNVGAVGRDGGVISIGNFEDPAVAGVNFEREIFPIVQRFANGFNHNVLGTTSSL